jgi:hypothetical protein
MTTEERVRKVEERVAQGVWDTQQFGNERVRRQCHFCCVAPGNDHDETCPVRLAYTLTDTGELNRLFGRE